mgnify:CR=1 FL=1
MTSRIGIFRQREVFYTNFMTFTDSLYCIFRHWGKRNSFKWNLLLQEEKSMEVKQPNKSLLFYAFVVMIILILLNALVIPKISERSVTETTYDEFLALLDAKYVKQV